MLRVLLSPDGESTAAALRAPEAPKRKRSAPAAKSAEKKESRGEELLHELFRACGRDTRSSKQTTDLVRDIASLFTKGV